MSINAIVLMAQHEGIVSITLKCNSPKFTKHKKISYKLDSGALNVRN